ncbi:MAG: RNA-binding protein [Dehalococcoidia bacterium]
MRFTIITAAVLCGETAAGLIQRNSEQNNRINDKGAKTMKIYVGNLAFEVTEDTLAAEFGVYGKVESVAIPGDRLSGRPRGFAFVDMPSKSEAETAIAGLNGQTLMDRTLVVNESRPRVDSRSGGSYGNRRGGSYGGGYGGGRGRGRSGGGRQRRY